MLSLIVGDSGLEVSKFGYKVRKYALTNVEIPYCIGIQRAGNESDESINAVNKQSHENLGALW